MNVRQWLGIAACTLLTLAGCATAPKPAEKSVAAPTPASKPAATPAPAAKPASTPAAPAPAKPKK